MKYKIPRIVTTLFSIFLGILLLLSGIFPSLTQVANAADFVIPDSAPKYVNDFAGIMSPSGVEDLNIELHDYDLKNGIQIVVATFPSLNGNEISSLATETFRKWGIGHGKKPDGTALNNGVLFLIAPNERVAFISVGYGLEGVLTDLQSSSIVRNISIPEFKNNNYEGGIVAGTQAIEKLVIGEAVSGLEDTSYSSRSANRLFGRNIQILFFFGLFLLQILSSILGSTKSWWLGGVLGGVAGIIVGIFFGFFFVGIISIVGLALLGLLFDYIVSKNYRKGGRGGGGMPWFIGGGGDSGGSNGGGWGGGFSGGGGSSGGGGGGGSW